MVAELKGLYDDLNLEKLRVSRPSKFVFLCGGAIGKIDGHAENLRDYLCRVRKIRLSCDIVLAEKAIQLYRDTDYGDLISFEEDIARISTVVLVIAESSGSLAELGAFTSNEIIRNVLRVLIQQKYEKEESFVRYGPIERVKKSKRANLGVYPWRTRSNGTLVKSSISPHYREILKFINEHIDAIPVSSQLNLVTETRLFFIIYWIVHLSLAIDIKSLNSYVRLLLPHVTDSDIKNKLYCMMIAGWIDRIAYSAKDYIYARTDADPFDYSFKDSVRNRDSVRRKAEVSEALSKADVVPRHVRTTAAQARVP